MNEQFEVKLRKCKINLHDDSGSNFDHFMQSLIMNIIFSRSLWLVSFEKSGNSSNFDLCISMM